MALPADDGRFDAATIAFGMRNLPDYGRGFAEMARVVRPGGKVVCLEIARPRSRLARILRWWFDRIVPSSGGSPARATRTPTSFASVQNYPAPERIAEIMREAGLVGIRWIGMSGGIVTIHVGHGAAARETLGQRPAAGRTSSDPRRGRPDMARQASASWLE